MKEPLCAGEGGQEIAHLRPRRRFQEMLAACGTMWHLVSVASGNSERKLLWLHHLVILIMLLINSLS